MKLFYSELQADYTTYTFPYCIYAILESAEDVTQIYANSFLPYSGNTAIEEDVFYLARATRINIAAYRESTNDRRLDKKTAHLGLSVKYVDKSAVDFEDEKLINFISNFQNERFINGEMTTERLFYIINKRFFNKVMIVSSEAEQKDLAYVFICEGNECMHYWFCFYDTQYMDVSLGKWIMYQAILLAKAQDKKYLYLGTSYSRSSLYKGDFHGFEFWDGVRWSDDKKMLSTLIENQDAASVSALDNYKNMDNLELRKIYDFGA